MDGLRDMAAALTAADKRDQLCTRGWVVTKELSSLKDGEPFNVCVLIRSLDTRHHGTMEVVNLKLGNSISDAIERRIPQATGETIQFDSAACKHTLVPNQVYMLVGAKMRYKDGGESLVRVPGTTESTATILLPTRADAIVGVAELCCGGVCGWSRAARELPAYPVIRVDHDGMSISTALLNEPREILHSDTQDQQRFTVFWGNVIDLRWVAALHDSNVEIFCCSPPSHPWSSKSETSGFKDTLNTTAWWEIAMVARLTQREPSSSRPRSTLQSVQMPKSLKQL